VQALESQWPLLRSFTKEGRAIRFYLKAVEMHHSQLDVFTLFSTRVTYQLRAFGVRYNDESNLVPRYVTKR
jgi:hypothetical protein